MRHFIPLLLCFASIFLGAAQARTFQEDFPAFSASSPALSREIDSIAKQSKGANGELLQLREIDVDPSEGAFLKVAMKYAALLAGFNSDTIKNDFPALYEAGKPIATFWNPEVGGNIVWGDPATLLYQDWTTDRVSWKRAKFNDAVFPSDDYCQFPDRMNLEEKDSQSYLVGSFKNRVNAASRKANRVEISFRLFREGGMALQSLRRFETPITRDENKKEIYGQEIFVGEKRFEAQPAEAMEISLKPTPPPNSEKTGNVPSSNPASSTPQPENKLVYWIATIFGAIVIVGLFAIAKKSKLLG